MRCVYEIIGKMCTAVCVWCFDGSSSGEASQIYVAGISLATSLCDEVSGGGLPLLLSTSKRRILRAPMLREAEYGWSDSQLSLP